MKQCAAVSTTPGDTRDPVHIGLQVCPRSEYAPAPNLALLSLQMIAAKGYSSVRRGMPLKIKGVLSWLA